MMRRTSPPKYRHDGTSPLPLGMDWSPPPKKWNGRDALWPHDHHTGWSYCVMIPSWIALPKSRSSASDPVVFYRVQVGIQSPEGVTTTRGVLRRFNDFLKLFSDLKKALPMKSIPSAPPKGLLRMKSRALLEERRCSLEEWMTKLLSDIDISRNVAVASFLELEAAARTSFQEAKQQLPEMNPHSNNTFSSTQFNASSSLPAHTYSTSIMSDYGSDTVYETSELGTPSLGRDDSSEVGMEDLSLDDNLENPIEKLVRYGVANIDEGLLMGETILDQLEGLPSMKTHTSQITDNGNSSKAAFLAGDGMDTLIEAAETAKEISHDQMHSNESIESDMGSYRGSEMSNSWSTNFLGEVSLDSLDLPADAVTSRTMGNCGGLESHFANGTQIVLPVVHRPKLNRVLVIMQRRLITAKTDMEDLLTRLNQEIAVKEYLTTKVKDLEVELEITKQKSKESMQQALLFEKERVMKMQWDMEELRRKSLEMEFRLKSQEDDKPHSDSSSSSFHEKDELLQELYATKEKLNSLLSQHEELEVKSKLDVKVLVKEVKSLRRSKNELQQQLTQSLTEKSEMEKLLQQEKEIFEPILAARRKLIHECEILHAQLRECNTEIIKDDNFITDSSTMSSVLDLLTKSDNQIDHLFSEAQSFAQYDTSQHGIPDNLKVMDVELRKLLRDMFVDNAKLRKQVNFFIRSAYSTDIATEDGKENLSTETVLERLSEA
ncbi:hypothetical protein Nepgr_000831 [Nepenthes gracilis]|uniref:PX domain-containing protein n=1 Tax=Nepenthes gracilis TaxID=150966 RepID=A0AAD3P4D0_NEPGR|nr:hypothetical protein Nepgr_000831 [Nepenthes gracilis]